MIVFFSRVALSHIFTAIFNPSVKQYSSFRLYPFDSYGPPYWISAFLNKYAFKIVCCLKLLEMIYITSKD